MLQESAFDVVGETYSVCYTARARYLFEEVAGKPLAQITSQDVMLSDIRFAQFVWAGLEGYRVRAKARAKPWTIDEVLDVVIASLEIDEREPIQRACLKAATAAFARPPKDQAEDPKPAEGKGSTTV